MKRRAMLRKSAATAAALIIGPMTTPTQAFVPPPLLVIAGVFISVAFRRYVVDWALAWLARTLPFMFATELRKYLIAVAVTLGLDQAKAAVVAEHAEDHGAVELARDGYELRTELEIRNENKSPLELVRLQLLLVDDATSTVERVSAASWGLVVAGESEMLRLIAANHFPNTGLKRWYLSSGTRTLAMSEPFLVVA